MKLKMKLYIKVEYALDSHGPLPSNESPVRIKLFCPLPSRTLKRLRNLIRSCPAHHHNPRPPRTFSVPNPHLSENH